MCYVLIHYVILCLHFALFPSRGVVLVYLLLIPLLVLGSYVSSLWFSPGGVLCRVSTDNFTPVVLGWPPGMIFILRGA